MKQVSSRVAALEVKSKGPVKFHVICAGESDEEREAAIDAYGRDRIGPDDQTVVITNFCPPGPLDGP